MYCQNCGAEIDDKAVVCVHCGVATRGHYSDNGGFGWNLLGFFFPFVGLILYLVWKDEKPVTAKAVGLGALVSVGAGLAFWLLMILLAVGSAISI